MLCIDVRAASNSAAQANFPAVMRSLQRPDAKKFVEYLSKQAENSVVLGPGGRPVGQVFELDKARLNRTGARIVRALHFVETGTPLPKDAVVRVGCNVNMRTIDAEFKDMARALAGFPERRAKYVGSAFAYLAALAPESSAWLMQLYDFFVWLGTVDYRRSRARI